jgi:sugar/nucleoside kinase (ribokinase family)
VSATAADPPDLLVLGDVNPDLTLSAPDLQPAFGQTETLVDSAALTLGGSASIMACAATALGVRTAVAGVIGDDPFGVFMAEGLRERGVDTRALVVDSATPTGLTTVLVRSDDRGMLTFPGTIAALTVEAIDAELLASARHIHIASFFLQPNLVAGLRDLCAQARRRGATVSLDPNWDPAERWDGGLLELLDEIDLLLPNAVEAMAIARCPDPRSAARRLARDGALVIVKLGAEGALAIGRGDELTVPSLAIEDPVDTIGAGDCFDAGLIASLLAGEPLRESLALACACGALSTRGPGGTGAQPSWAEARAHAIAPR